MNHHPPTIWIAALAAVLVTLAAPGVRAHAIPLPDPTHPTGLDCPAGSVLDDLGLCVFDGCPIVDGVHLAPVTRQWLRDGTFVDFDHEPDCTPDVDPVEPATAAPAVVLDSSTVAATYEPTAADVNDLPLPPSPVARLEPNFTG